MLTVAPLSPATNNNLDRDLYLLDANGNVVSTPDSPGPARASHVNGRVSAYRTAVQQRMGRLVSAASAAYRWPVLAACEREKNNSRTQENRTCCGLASGWGASEWQLLGLPVETALHFEGHCLGT